MSRKQKQHPKTEPVTRLAEGAVSVPHPYSEPSKVIPENIPGFLQNIHLADAVNNLTRQIYSSEPELWVTDENGENIDSLTAWLSAEFARLDCWNLMRYVIPDTYQWGAFVYSIGIEYAEGEYRISEIRHLPADSFSVIPPTYSASMTIPNPLMPGIIIDENGTAQVWQTNRATGQHTLLQNVQFVKATGTPSPSGSAFLYPCYFLVARMDFAEQARLQQVSRAGAPRITPKVRDDASDAEYRKLQEWHNRAGKFWNGKDTSILVPPGIEFPQLNIRENTVASDYVERCVDWIRTYCNPMSDLTSANGLGQSDTGRMEMWVNFLSAEQTLCEHWLEELFEYILASNGDENVQVHIELKRPSLDRSALRLQALGQLASANAITPAEMRDNLTDILELKQFEDVALELKQLKSETNPYASLFGNTEDPKQPEDTRNYTKREREIMQRVSDQLTDVHTQMADAVARILDRGPDGE